MRADEQPGACEHLAEVADGPHYIDRRNIRAVFQGDLFLTAGHRLAIEADLHRVRDDDDLPFGEHGTRAAMGLSDAPALGSAGDGGLMPWVSDECAPGGGDFRTGYEFRVGGAEARPRALM